MDDEQLERCELCVHMCCRVGCHYPERMKKDAELRPQEELGSGALTTAVVAAAVAVAGAEVVDDVGDDSDSDSDCNSN